MTTTDLIPTDGVFVTENYSPPGFYVARYDKHGFTSSPRWFPTRDKADAYAAKLRGQS